MHRFVTKDSFRAVPVETNKSKQRIARRTSRRLHELRTQGHFLMPSRIHEVEPRCSECGTEQSNYTEACGTCVDRRAGRGRRHLQTRSGSATVSA